MLKSCCLIVNQNWRIIKNIREVVSEEGESIWIREYEF